MIRSFRIFWQQWRDGVLDWEDVREFFRAYWRYWTLRWQPIRIQYIFEQRKKLAKPECIKKGRCEHCHCSMPVVLLANKGCFNGCYKAMSDV